MKVKYKFILLLLICCFSVQVYAEQELPMSVISRNIVAYNNFLKEKNKPVLEIKNLESKYSNRNIACMVIIMQALDIGGYSAKMKIIEVPNYAREVKMVKSGNTVIMHQDAWNFEFDNKVFQSSEIIAKGNFVKGLYVAESDIKMYQVKTVENLKKYTSVSSHLWKVDWKTLKKIGLKKLFDTPKKEFMLNQVLFRNVDFTIQEFSNSSDLAYETKNGRLIPVPGIKLALDGSRHIMVSKKHAEGQKVFIALEKGLKILKENGTIDRFLEEAGFYNRKVSDWRTISVD